MIDMKKTIALLMAVLLLFTLASCKSDEQPSTDNSSSTTDTVAFTAPESYATVLLVTINPEFKLYLDEQGSVLAVEPVNSDAKSMAKDVENIKGDLETVIQEIVAAADKSGFVKENATVDFQVAVVKDDTVNTDVIVNTVKDTADKALADLEKPIEVKVSVAEDVLVQTTASVEQTSSVESVASVASTASHASSHQASAVKPQSTASQAHKHSFSAATCTEPKKCSCGATEGKAFGHKYANGVCTVCGAKDPNFVSYTSFKNKTGRWKLQYVSGTSLYTISMTLHDSANYENGIGAGYDIGDLVDGLPEDMKADIQNNYENYKDSIVTYQGKQYFVGRGSGDDLASVKEDGTTVTITDLRGAKLVLKRTAENTMTVQSADNSFVYLEDDAKIPAGAVCTFQAK